MTPFDGDWPWARRLVVDVGWSLHAFPSTRDRVHHLLVSVLLHTPRRACYVLVLHTEKGMLCTCATHREGHVMYLCYTPSWGCCVLVLHTELGMLCTCATHREGEVMYLCYPSSWGCYVLVLHTEKGRLCTCATHREGEVMYLCYTPRRGGYVLVLHSHPGHGTQLLWFWAVCWFTTTTEKNKTSYTYCVVSINSINYDN